ncbi:hypothetical protein EDB19DRAFT_1658838 [Suillus lakei]|nr:hypothetical protein EDB19DRAFT_1658838 [Suillus lakei]
MKSQTTSKSSPRTSPYDVENASKGKRMTKDQVAILNHFYAKDTHPGPDHLAMLARAINEPVKKVHTWYNNRRCKEARLERNSSLGTIPLCFSQLNIRDDADWVDDDFEDEAGGVQGAQDPGDLDQEALYQEARARVAAMANISAEEVDAAFIDQDTRAARACVLAMAKMKPDEVNAAFILTNLNRRNIVHPPKK